MSFRPWILAVCVASAAMTPAFAATKSKSTKSKPASSAPKECRPSAEEAALHVRALKEEMMVGALSCDSRSSYNDFATKFESELKSSGKRMQAFFRTHGGTSAFDQMNTKLANEAMRQHMEKGTPVFCDGAKKLFDEVLALPVKQLPDYALKRPFPIASPVKQTCPVQPMATASVSTP